MTEAAKQPGKRTKTRSDQRSQSSPGGIEFPVFVLLPIGSMGLEYLPTNLPYILSPGS